MKCIIINSEKRGDFSFSFTVMLLEFAATPGSLQKSFLKRKQNFIQESQKRIEAIKNKERENEKLGARRLQGGKSKNLRSKQKESGLLSGRFILGQDTVLCIPSIAALYQRIDFIFATHLLLQTGIFVSQGIRELCFPPLSGCLFSVVKALTGALHVSQSAHLYHCKVPLQTAAAHHRAAIFSNWCISSAWSWGLGCRLWRAMDGLKHKQQPQE